MPFLHIPGTQSQVRISDQAVIGVSHHSDIAFGGKGAVMTETEIEGRFFAFKAIGGDANIDLSPMGDLPDDYEGDFTGIVILQGDVLYLTADQVTVNSGKILAYKF